MYLLIAVLMFQLQTEPSEVEIRRVEMTLRATHDEEGFADCRRHFAPAEASVHLGCRLDADGDAEHCELTNPSPEAERSAPLFQCMVQHMNWRFSNGFSTEGLIIPIPFGVDP